jgi:hypothetical protein
LIEQFSALAGRAQDQVVDPLSRGEPPDARTVEDIHTAIADYQAVTAEMPGLGFTDRVPVGLPELLKRLNQTVEGEPWEQCSRRAGGRGSAPSQPRTQWCVWPGGGPEAQPARPPMRLAGALGEPVERLADGVEDPAGDEARSRGRSRRARKWNAP